MTQTGVAPLSATELYHVGIVTPDLEVGMARFTELLGVRWGPIFEAELPNRFADGQVRPVALRVSYSLDHPHLELIEEVPGTLWVCNPHSNLHHLGVWTGDLLAASAGLSAAGCPFEVAGAADDGPAPQTFAYHRDEALGVRIEAVDGGVRPIMEAIWAEARGEGG